MIYETSIRARLALGLVLCVSFMVLLPSPSQGQFDAISALFESADGISIYPSIASVVSEDKASDAWVLKGGGIELYLEPGDVELALGIEYQGPVPVEVPELDFHASILTLPAVMAYKSWAFSGSSPMGVYLGGGVAMWSLSGARGYTEEGRSYAVSGRSFGPTAALGLYHDEGVFAQLSVAVRRFDSLEWESGDKINLIPEGWPRELDLSSVKLAVGWQFGIDRGKKD